MAQSDPNKIIRRLPIVVGALGECLFFLNRVFTPELLSSQSRSDALGVIVCAVLILVGLLWRQLQPTAPEAVELEGESGFELDPDLPESVKTELAWASHILLTNTVTRSLAIYYQGKTILRRGVLGPEREVKPGAIAERVLTQQKPVYLVALKLYPGKVEFNYLPDNTQGVICQPIGSEGVLVLGANAPRSYTRQDEAWVDAIANKLDYTLSQASSTLEISG
ncbi:hypothetical protein C1752_00018 [Acaryochloris thomasi RCC1774]|uniref:Cofactor assembly of complex C subunit B n=1 Tax=Acaryochloris thomasi RCC1774 TaxID=1764569 RepID=A0A2W1K6Q9_9CYAN|nr:cofactor assembly of complex C subunit B [Acaryochloris thomasi]PZD75277.1 hypothetical protein C1752_00018 [Acaryochloris thomasi RCC1774]